MISRVVDRVVEEKCTIYACDICKNECGNEPQKYLKECKMCGKEVCKECRVTKYEKYDSDYPSYYCNHCWEVGEPFRKQYKALEEKYEIESDDILNKWKKACNNDGC
jgi:hypothetical protein